MKFTVKIHLMRILPALLLIWAGWSPAWAETAEQDDLYERVYLNVSLFGDVYREVALKYVDQVDPDEFMRAGIEGMLSTLDPYTVFFDDEGAEDLELITLGKYGGVGLEIGVRGEEKVLTVISPMDDSPAQRVGIRSGDRIIAVDDKPTSGFTTTKAARLMRGDPGTLVKLTVERTGSSEPIEFLITRQEIEVRDVSYYGFVQPDVGYIKLSHFSRRATDELDEALHELKRNGMETLILDLRGNPGGLLSSAIGVLQRFCEKNELVLSTRGRSPESNRDYKITSEPISGDVPIAVLIDGGSASASEIVAGAIQDLDRGVIIGEPTFGKGLVQSVVHFQTGEALKMTTAKYYTPSGRLIQKVDYFGEDQEIVVSGAEESPQEEFSTRNGRLVEGGGGISPDIEIPTPKPGRFGTELWRHGTFFDYVAVHRAKHPNLTTADVDDAILDEFRQWLGEADFSYDVDGQQEIEQLREMLQEAELSDSASADLAHLEALLEMRRDFDFNSEREFIRRSLEREIATSLWGTRGRIEASFDHDPHIQKALEILTNEKDYRSLLVTAGEKENGGKPEE